MGAWQCITAAELIGWQQVEVHGWDVGEAGSPPVTPVEQIKNGCTHSVQIWFLYVSGIHHFHDGGCCSLSCIPVWIQPLSLCLSPEQQQGDQLSRCVENLSMMRACHSHRHTHMSTQVSTLIYWYTLRWICGLTSNKGCYFFSLHHPFTY